MAINSNILLGDKNPARSLCSSKTSNLSSCRLIKINFAGKDSCCSSRAQGRSINSDIKSPYFTNDKFHPLSRVTAKKATNKKPETGFVSSFPLAASVYKANSDEFKLKKQGSKKVKKSVLTLPNEPVPMPKAYTVSDFNDSEYFTAANDSKANKAKKKRPIKRTKKSRVKERTMEIPDRDARYCSQLNIDLDCSSSEIINFTGDGERISKMSYKSNNSVKAGNYPHDVWAVLRNISKFQFRPSPPGSQKSVVPLRKRRPIIARNKNINDTHYIETCHTEEFAYISSFEVDSKTHESCSPSSSFDRVTVIDKQSEQDETLKQFIPNIFGANLKVQEKIKSNTNNESRRKNKTLKNYNKRRSHGKRHTEASQIAANDMCNDITLQGEEEHIVVKNCDNIPLPEVKTISRTSSVYKPTENCSDKSSIKENDSACNDQINHFRKVFRSSDNYKDNNNIKSLMKSSNNKTNMMKPIGDTAKQLNGITKVIFSKGIETLSPQLLEPQRKPRLALTLPNNKNMPKLSRFEIRRRLANQKFPIVILGKDQLTNRGIHVTNVDAPQFDGLDKYVWPFMLKWSEEKTADDVVNIQTKETIKPKNPKGKNKVHHYEEVPSNTNELSRFNILRKKNEYKKRKNSTLLTTYNQTQLATEVSSHVVSKSKPLTHLKNKMFNFLHKHPASPNVSEHDWNINRQIETVLKDKQVGTNETIKANMINSNKEFVDKPVENKIVQKQFSPLSHPWAKGKWASDFIENIIKKIRSGVYYGVDRKENKHKIGGNEISTQTEINTSKDVYCQNSVDLEFASNIELKKDDPLKDIPGFDETLTTLEIETISTNKIAIKHCITNVTVHFDIQVLGEARNVTHTNKSMSCIPINVDNTQEKVFRCNTSLINAILPAELCSIIPSVMQNIIHAENKLQLQTPIAKNILCHSTPVSQFADPGSPRLIMSSILLGSAKSAEIRAFSNGRFRNNLNNKIIRTNLLHPTESMDTVALFPRLNTQSFCFYNHPSFVTRSPIITLNALAEKSHPEINKTNNNKYCMALQPYEPKRFSIVPFLGLFSITDFIKQIVDRYNVFELNKKIKIIFDFAHQKKNIIMNSPLLLSRHENQDVLSVTLNSNKLGVISLFNALKRNDHCTNEEFILTLNNNDTNGEEKKEKSRIFDDESETGLRKKGLPIKVLRKKSYIRFYRKCNSMSSISSYKCTPLSKVTNLEEFCQVLGSSLFINVLDGCLEKKVMNAIHEIKHWITEISSKQALLILLLINKKDTSSLIRFRPVLLQGIAVNRITKADELDTEIEVIERENFHKLSQFEGISYMPASPKNQDSLLEELCWIAKTTASDYQKPFNESSEKLLKSLLEKRKKLNPSYLRVMARYVGLGLLAPIKL